MGINVAERSERNMKKTGMTRAIDEVGRIVLPKEIRETMDLKTKDELEISVEDGKIILSKFQPSCVLCGEAENLVIYNENKICKNCIANIAKLK